MLEILSKLGVDTREEAAEYWRRYNGVAPRFSRLFRGITGGGVGKWITGGAVLLGAGLVTVAIAFGGGDAQRAEVERDDTQKSTSPTPPDSTLVGRPTVDPMFGWQPAQPGPCPLQDELVCDMAIQLEVAFRVGDLDAVMALAEPFAISCPARPDLLSDSVCGDSPAGTVRQAYGSGKWGGAAGLIGDEAMRTLLGDRIASATLLPSSERDFRIAALGCGVPDRSLRARCDQFAVVLVIPASSGDGVLRLAFRRTTEGEPRVFGVVNDVPWNEDLRGATYTPLGFGTGSYFPASSGYFYPWTPE